MSCVMSNQIHNIIIKAEVDAFNMVSSRMAVVLAVRWMDRDRFLWVQHQDAIDAALGNELFHETYRMRVELLRGMN